MVGAEQARKLLAPHGQVVRQSPSDWSGSFSMPACLARFYEDVGPKDVYVEAYGNAFFLPRLAVLWKMQAGYRWNGLTKEPIEDWDDDWLVVADQGGDPFILSRSSGLILFDVHGCGEWEPRRIFADLNTMAACLGQLGEVAVSAGAGFTDDECRIVSRHRDRAAASLRRLLGSAEEAASVLEMLAWD